jgi:hypothetical protein
VLILLPSQAMAEQDWTPSTITQGHLQNLAKQGFMMAAKLTACRVPEDPAFLAPSEGYVVSFMALYEQRFGTPLHRFLHSLLQYYGLELHTLALSGVDPEFNLWNYFFRVWRLQDPDVELTVSNVWSFMSSSGMELALTLMFPCRYR